MSSTIRLYFPDKIQSDLSSHLTNEQTHYVKDVMRLKIGDKLSIFNTLGAVSYTHLRANETLRYLV